MGFKEALEADKAVFMNHDEFAIPVTYKRKGSPDLEISGVFSNQDGFDSRPGSVGRTGLLVVWVSDLAKPKHGDVVVIDEEEWTVMPNIKGGEISWILEVTNGLRPRF